MKKFTLAVLFCLAVWSGLAAQSRPSLFAFNMGGMISYNLTDSSMTPSSPFGIQFYFDDTFFAGYTFDDGMDLSLMHLGFTPSENINVMIYTGQNGTANVAFGLGFGYDFLVNPERFFSAVGIYINWFGTDTGGDFEMSSGGALDLGLRMQFGI